MKMIVESMSSIPRKGTNICPFHHFQTSCGFPEPTIQWVPRAIYQGIKRPGYEVDH
jgi:hypothetical protein